MWIHIVIFGILLVVFIGSKAGWFSSKKEEKDRSLSLFLAVALAGNLLGMALTVQNGDSQVYVEGTGLKKEEDQTYEEKFMVSVDGKKAGSMYVQIPEKELEEEQEKTQENHKGQKGHPCPAVKLQFFLLFQTETPSVYCPFDSIPPFCMNFRRKTLKVF